MSVEAPAEVPAENLAEVPVEDAPTEPVIGGATDSSAAAGANDPTEAFTRIPHDAAGRENTGERMPPEKNPVLRSLKLNSPPEAPKTGHEKRVAAYGFAIEP